MPAKFKVKIEVFSMHYGQMKRFHFLYSGLEGIVGKVKREKIFSICLG